MFEHLLEPQYLVEYDKITCHLSTSVGIGIK